MDTILRADFKMLMNAYIRESCGSLYHDKNNEVIKIKNYIFEKKTNFDLYFLRLSYDCVDKPSKTTISNKYLHNITEKEHNFAL